MAGNGYMAKQKNNNPAGGFMLLGAAFVWGVAFVFQVEGMDHVTPVTFMASRCLLASVFLAILVIVVRGPRDAFKFDANTVKGGLGCGIAITIANNLQQIGVQYTTAGKAGFITAMYMLLVPIYGALIFRRRTGLRTWAAVLIGAAGMYFLCIKEGFTIGQGDAYVIGCAIVFAGHIVCADYFAPKADAVKMSFLQFFVSFVLSTVWAFIAETPTFEQIWDARVSIAYCGFVSAGIGYTLQLLGQQRTKPEAASLIMSLESVFAALAGWVMLKEAMSGRELFGCALLFGAIILVQTGPGSRKLPETEASAAGETPETIAAEAAETPEQELPDRTE